MAVDESIVDDIVAARVLISSIICAVSSGVATCAASPILDATTNISWPSSAPLPSSSHSSNKALQRFSSYPNRENVRQLAVVEIANHQG